MPVNAASKIYTDDQLAADSHICILPIHMCPEASTSRFALIMGHQTPTNKSKRTISYPPNKEMKSSVADVISIRGPIG